MSSPGSSSTPLTYTPIGVLRTPFATKDAAPTQGAFVPDATGVIELDECWLEGLDDIELFSHLLVLYAMDRVTEVDLKPLPFLDDDRHGIFATRNPRRPNPIGLMVVRLDRREGRRLFIGQVDALDRSPVLDIKPYVPRFDSVPDASEGWFLGKRNRPKPPGRE